MTQAMSPVTDLLACLQAFWPHQKFTGEQIAALLESKRFARFDVSQIRDAVRVWFAENPDQRGPNWSAIGEILWGEHHKAKQGAGLGGELVGWFRTSKSPECRELVEQFAAQKIDASVLAVWRRGRDAVAFHNAYRGAFGAKWQTQEQIDASVAQLRQAVTVSKNETEGRYWLGRVDQCEQAATKRRASLASLYSQITGLVACGPLTHRWREAILGQIRNDAMFGGCYAEVCGANIDGTVAENEHPF